MAGTEKFDEPDRMDWCRDRCLRKLAPNDSNSGSIWFLDCWRLTELTDVSQFFQSNQRKQMAGMESVITLVAGWSGLINQSNFIKSIQFNLIQNVLNSISLNLICWFSLIRLISSQPVQPSFIRGFLCLIAAN